MRVVCLCPEPEPKPSRIYHEVLTMEDEFLIPVGDGTYQIMTARELLVSENREAKELTKSIIKHQ